jgi:putative NADH-flavin reductase
MKILIIGATGMIGSRIADEALSRGHHVIAASRSGNGDARENLEHIALDINDVGALSGAAARADVVVSAVSPRNSGDAVDEATRFTSSLIDSHRETGKRILMVGGGSSLNMPDGRSGLDLTPEAILPEATGMRKAYAMLVTADIDFVVLAPGGHIEPGERTGKFRMSGRTMLTDEEGGKSRISAEDYAIAMMDEVETPSHFRTIFNVGY